MSPRAGWNRGLAIALGVALGIAVFCVGILISPLVLVTFAVVMLFVFIAAAAAGKLG